MRTRVAATACFLFAAPLLAAPGETPLRLSGYGEINYWRFDYGPDQKSLPEGSAPDNRALIDVTRLALEFEAELLPVLVFLLAAAGMGIGVLMRRPPVRGSCGGCAKCLCI